MSAACFFIAQLLSAAGVSPPELLEPDTECFGELLEPNTECFVELLVPDTECFVELLVPDTESHPELLVPDTESVLCLIQSTDSNWTPIHSHLTSFGELCCSVLQRLTHV